MRKRHVFSFSLILALILVGCSQPVLLESNAGTDLENQKCYKPKSREAFKLYNYLISSKQNEIDMLTNKGRISDSLTEKQKIIEEVNSIYQEAFLEVELKYGKDWNQIFEYQNSNNNGKTIVGTSIFGEQFSSSFQSKAGFIGYDSYTQNRIFFVTVYGRENINGIVRNAIYNYVIEELPGCNWLGQYWNDSSGNPFCVENGQGVGYSNAKITTILADDTNTNIQIGVASTRPANAVQVRYQDWASTLKAGEIREYTQNNVTYDGSVFEASAKVEIPSTIWEGQFDIVVPCYPTAVKYPWTYLAGDFNGDNKDDIYAQSAWSDKVRVYLSTGTNINCVDLGYGWSNPGNFEIMDFNGDGKDDICARWGDGLYVYLSNGTGVTRINLGLGWANPGNFKILDFNGDGKDDICARWGDGVYVYLSNGSNWTRIPLGLGWANPGNFEIMDFNGDGKDDICARWGDGLYVYLSNGTGVTRINLGLGWANPGNFKILDFNGDGKDDICARWGDGVYVYLSTGSSWIRIGLGLGWANPGNFEIMDFNGDGKDDICARWGDRVYVYLSTGAGVNRVDLGCGWNNPEVFGVLDFNGDGKSDIVARWDGIDYIYLSNGNNVSRIQLANY